MLIPPSLRPGDTVAIVPTARAITADELQAGMDLLESWGLRVQLGSGVGRKAFQQAGTAAERTADLQAAIDDPGVRAIWCARGGYGTVHLLDGLDLSPLLKDPKWIAGFSDVTVLHNALHHLGVASLHAQMPFHVDRKSDATRDTLRKALFGEGYSVSSGQRAVGDRPGTCEGVLVGGNLSVLYSLRGTPADLDPMGKILFLEDLDELLYHVDRMVQNLRSGGWFRGLAGLIVGGMTDMHDKDPADPFGRSAEAIITEAIGEVGYPVCFGFPTGHGRENQTLVLGAKAKLSVTPEGATLSFERPDRPGAVGA